MHAASAYSSLSGKHNKYRPIARQASGFDVLSLKLAVLSFLLFFLVVSSISVSTSPIATISAVPHDSTAVAQDSNVITYSIPENVQIAEGNVSSYRGFAYHVRDTDIVYFVDPIQDISFQVAVPDGSFQTTLVGADIDDDGSTEYMFTHRDSSTSTYELVVVDFDTLSYETNYNIPNWYHTIREVGDFDNTGVLDIYLRHNGYQYHTIFEVASNSTIGQWNTSTNAQYSSVGRYYDGAKDYLALGIDNGVARNISVFDGFGNLMNQLDHYYFKDFDTIDHGDAAEDLVVVDYYGNATVYHGENLTVAYEVSLRGTATGNFFVQSGNITLDEYEDFYAFERYDEQAYLVDGRNGTVLHVVDDVALKTMRAFDLGEIDADERTDALVLGISGSPGLLRGADGEVSYVETLIENPIQFIVHEVTGDNKDDMLLRVITDVGSDIYIIKSDTEAPILTPSPLDPLHPTVLDDFITVGVSVDDSSPIDLTLLHYREVGDTVWLEPHDGLFSTTDGITHYAFLVGLDGGNYEYYIQFRDAFLNVGEIGSPSTPQSLTVQGNLAWETEPPGNSLLQSYEEDYCIAEGNMTNGSKVIYVAKATAALDKVRLLKYNEYGNLLDFVDLPDFFLYDFALLTGNFDGDNVTDPVVLVSEKDGDATTYVFHGYNFTSNYNSTNPIFAKIYQHIEVYDVDEDELDEIVLVTATEPRSMGIMDDDGTWSWRLLPLDNENHLSPDAMAVGKAASVPDTHIALERDENLIEIYRTSDLAVLQSIVPNYGSYTAADVVDIEVFHNASRSSIQFLVEFRLWDGTNPYTAFAFIDRYTSTLDVADMEIIPERVHRYGHVHDVDGDGTDEIFAITTAGEISLIQFNPKATIIWDSTMSDANPTVSVVTDFLGEGTEQLAIFTDEDERLTIIDFNGKIHRDLYIGEVHGAFAIGNVDAGEGNEIAAFPIVKDGEGVLGAVRDLDWYYRLNVTSEFSPTVVAQNAPLDSEVEIRNIYGEIIEDATVYTDVYLFEEVETRTDTFGYFFSDNSTYQASVPASWPIGLVNLSLRVEHIFYHSYWILYSEALTIQSDLMVQVIAPEFVLQGENQTIQVIVTDNRGFPILDANVTIEIDGVEFDTLVSEPFYEYAQTSVSLPVGVHSLMATANHQYSPAESNVTTQFIVQTISENLVIADNLPRVLIQHESVVAWFNITDAFGYPIAEADMVKLQLGPFDYVFQEDPSSPGCYSFEGQFNLGMGNHTLTLIIQKNDITNPNAMEVEIEVFGELDPIIQIPETVEAEETFEIVVFMRDSQGPVFQGTSVWIEMGGVIYNATQDSSDPARFSVEIAANFPAGPNTFRVYAFAQYDIDGWTNMEQLMLSVHSAAIAEVLSSVSGEITQGDTTRIRVAIMDWLATPLNHSTVTMFLGGSLYILQFEEPGIYGVNVDTTGWLPRIYQYSIFVQDDFADLEGPLNGTLTVRGLLTISIEMITETAIENQLLEFEITVVDEYGNPIPDLELIVELWDSEGTENIASADIIHETDEVGTYIATFSILPFQNWGDDKKIVVSAANEICEEETVTITITVNAAQPEIALGVETVSISGGLAFLLSFIGMAIYLKMASSMKIQEDSMEKLEKSVRRMDQLYLVIVILTGAAAVTSYLSYTMYQFELAVGLSIVILGASIVLYGIWLYRDAVASIMVNDKLDRTRMILGLWHLVFLPLSIVMIMSFGSQINWFNQLVITPSVTFGTISIPSILTTVITAFLSSILVVVLNVYREISGGIQKIDKMEAAGTPADVLRNERSLMVKKTSSSIRMKFLIFLGLVGSATVLSLDFLLSQYSLIVIVLIIVVFLVVIPFLSSKILSAIGFMKSKVSGDSEESSLPY